MPTKKIKDHYVEAFSNIRRKCGGEEDSRHEIGPDVSLKEAIEYTRKYVVEHTQKHFRYKYYNKALSSAITRLCFNPADRQVVHLDIGCGPGLFLWVVYDHMLRSQHTPDPNCIDFIGYDHAKSMIQLANRFLDHLPVKYAFSGYSDIGKILAMLDARDFSNSDVVVTFGHVLIQAKKYDPDAMHKFSKIIRRLFPLNSCILIAVDAYGDAATRQAFREAHGKLRTCLNDAGVKLEKSLPGPQRSCISARLSLRE